MRPHPASAPQPARNSSRLERYHRYGYKYTRPELGIKELGLLGHLRQLIVEGTIYFPPPQQLNDPIDCRPRMIAPSPASAIAYTVRRGRARISPTIDAQERKRQRRAARSRLHDPAWRARTHESNARRFGILSLSHIYPNEHLWSTYADAHSGVCICFDFDAIGREPIGRQRQ